MNPTVTVPPEFTPALKRGALAGIIVDHLAGDYPPVVQSELRAMLMRARNPVGELEHLAAIICAWEPKPVRRTMWQRLLAWRPWA